MTENGIFLCLQAYIRAILLDLWKVDLYNEPRYQAARRNTYEQQKNLSTLEITAPASRWLPRKDENPQRPQSPRRPQKARPQDPHRLRLFLA